VLLADGYESGTALTVSRSPLSLTSFGGLTYLAVSVFAPEKAGSVTLTLNCNVGGNVLSSSATVKTGSWQTVFFDVSGAGDATVSSINLTLKASASGNHRFLIDAVGGCKTPSSVFKLKFFTDHFTPVGCALTDGKNLVVNLTGEGDQYIEGKAAVGRLPENTGISVKYSAPKGVKSMVFTYTVGGSSYSKAVTLKVGRGEAVFTVPHGAMDTFRLSFGGQGDLTVDSVTLTSCYTPLPSLGMLTQTRISRDMRSISVKGSLHEGVYEKYSSGKLVLYALPFGADISELTSAGELVSETEISSRFSFNIRLNEGLDGIYKKYAVMIKHGGELIPVCAPKTVSNPSAIAEHRTVFPESIKGSAKLSESYVFDGIAQTTVFVYADTLMTMSESGIPYEAGGRTYYFSSDTVAELDKRMKELGAEGIDVRLMLRLRTPSDLALKALLCHPRSGMGEYLAFNTENEVGLGALRSIASFLVDRYGAGGTVTDNAIGIILGSDVNMSAENYDLGSTSLAQVVDSYSAAYRTVYIAARSRCADFEVSLGLGGVWSSSTSASLRGDFGARDFLRSFAEAISDGGDMEWALSYDVSADSYAYSLASAEMSYDAKRISGANLEVLTGFMSGTDMTYNGTIRRIALVGSRVTEAHDGETLDKMTADYVFTYLKAMGNGNVIAYVPAHPYGEAVRYIDTAEREEGCRKAIELIGKARFDELCALTNKLDGRYLGVWAAVDALPDGIKGTLTLWSFEKGSDGWLPSLNCISAEGGVTYSGERDLMRVRLDRIGAGAYGGVSSEGVRLDLTEAPYISFDVSVASLPEGVDCAELTVAVYSGQSVHMTTVTVYSGRVNTVVCDVSDFPYLSSCDRIAVYVSGTEGQDVSDPTLLMGSIRVHSTSLTDTELKASVLKPSGSRGTVELKTVLIVSALALVSIVTLALRIAYRRKFTAERR
jgi:hypothetical protein